MMNKHQTLAYIKYGELINKINDIIADHDTKNDIYKFLSIFPCILKDPTINCFNLKTNRTANLTFAEYTNTGIKFTEINFDGKNNFYITLQWPYNKWTSNYSTWASIDDIDHYIELYPNDFNNIIE